VVFNNNLSSRFYKADQTTAPPVAPNQPITGKYQQWSWAYQILPFVEQDNLWQLNQPNGNNAATDGTASGSPTTVLGSPVKLLACPSRRIAATKVINNTPLFLMDFAWNGGFSEANGTNFNGLAAPLYVSGSGNSIVASIQPIKVGNIPDGASNTLMISEKYVPVNIDSMASDAGDQYGAYYFYNSDTVRFANVQPLQDGTSSTAAYAGNSTVPALNNQAFVTHPFGSAHPAAMNAAMADGSVRSIRYSVDLDTFKKACGRNDKLNYNLDDL
jgi:prepilin-type processing-associated H-X9-DG protein